jgi:hypothetical protein
VAGDADVSDRVSVIADVEKVDAAHYTADVRVWVIPRGRFTSDDGETANSDIQVLSSGLSGGSLSVERGRRIPAQTIPIELEEGDITNYPFDRYSADLYFSAVSKEQNIPVEVTVQNSDAFFKLGASSDSDPTEPGLHLALSRSASTYLMVVLMFLVMWALALAVAAAAVVIVRNRLGLVWPALGWMTASLFALALFRGTAPGNPPIGCILDYSAFLWAESIITLSLTYVAARGVLLEWEKSAP